jgi:uncharacterized protein YdeI (YjbR/CyaY-like superfamily)
MNPKIDNYLANGCMRCEYGGTPDCKVHPWADELKMLRNLVLSCGLTEELKWGVPCYTYNGKNILNISALKHSATIGFFKGALLNDSENILVKPGENSQAARYLKFTTVSQIQDIDEIIRAYIFEAIEIEKAGLEIQFKKNPEPVPDELQEKLDNDPMFNSAWESLTPGRQRGYIIYFSQPKQSKTRVNRIEKYTPNILNGEGMHDKYSSGKQ